MTLGNVYFVYISNDETTQENKYENGMDQD